MCESCRNERAMYLMDRIFQIYSTEEDTSLCSATDIVLDLYEHLLNIEVEDEYCDEEDDFSLK